jgi:UDP-N-acetylmuramyl pentapeptide synthase
MKVIKGATKHFDDNESLIKYLEDLNFYNSIILIKGSRKLHLEEIKEYLEERY